MNDTLCSQDEDAMVQTDVVVLEGSTILEQLSAMHESLLIRRDALRESNSELHCVDGEILLDNYGDHFARP